MNDDLLASDMSPFDAARLALTRASVAPTNERLLRVRHAMWFCNCALREALRGRHRSRILRASDMMAQAYCILATIDDVDPIAEVFGPGKEER